MRYLTKKEAADHFGATKQWMQYRSKKTAGVFPSYMNEDGTKVDVESEVLLLLVKKLKSKVDKKVIRGVAPGYVSDKKTTVKKKSSKKTVKKKNPKKSKEDESDEKSGNESGSTDDDLETSADQTIGETSDISKLMERSEIAKCQQEIFKAEKQQNELLTSRNELISRELVADVLVSYLESLSKEIMQMPVSIIQELQAGIEAGKSNIDLINDLRKHLSIAIKNTKKVSINEMRRLLK